MSSEDPAQRSNPDFDQTPNRRGRLPRRPRDERGLPDEAARKELARTYLTAQCRLWPELVKTGVLRPVDEASVELLADEFKARFVAEDQPGADAKFSRGSWDSVGASYLRYSDPSSNPRSLDQQLLLQLERARRDNVFVPWALVFADAAVSGTTADRRGYQRARGSIQQAENPVRVLYIDEIGRASRYAIEALRLGRTIEQAGKRMIGVSDGFDSGQPHSKMMLSMFAMFQEWFVDQLRAKVNRGMDDTFRRGGNTHPPSFGY